MKKNWKVGDMDGVYTKKEAFEKAGKYNALRGKLYLDKKYAEQGYVFPKKIKSKNPFSKLFKK